MLEDRKVILARALKIRELRDRGIDGEQSSAKNMSWRVYKIRYSTKTMQDTHKKN